MYNLQNILNAANYESLCDYSFIPPYGKFGSTEMFNRPGNIFCKTDYIEQLFDILQKYCNVEHNLITHHSDYPIDEYRWNLKPKSIKKWYAINPTHKHPDLIAIPLGLKTHRDPYFEPQYMTEWLVNNIVRLRHIKKEKNIYCNWNVTNLERTHIIDQLKTSNIQFTLDIKQPFNTYIENMAQHRFVLSPPGNGIDCHRTWEALYCGCIPIVIKNDIYNDWQDLPILQVNSYNDIPQEILDTFIKLPYNFEKLRINYWTSYVRK
jgi:hypothetical protein